MLLHVSWQRNVHLSRALPAPSRAFELEILLYEFHAHPNKDDVLVSVTELLAVPQFYSVLTKFALKNMTSVLKPLVLAGPHDVSIIKRALGACQLKSFETLPLGDNEYETLDWSSCSPGTQLKLGLTFLDSAFPVELSRGCSSSIKVFLPLYEINKSEQRVLKSIEPHGIELTYTGGSAKMDFCQLISLLRNMNSLQRLKLRVIAASIDDSQNEFGCPSFLAEINRLIGQTRFSSIKI